MSYLLFSAILLLLGLASGAKSGGGSSAGQGQYGAGSYGANDGSYNGQDASAYAAGGAVSSSSYEQPEHGYSNPAPTKYPPAMTHERNRQQSGYEEPAYAKKYQQEKFEGLFDDFPGPKTKQRIYYPGRGYVYMEVPIQQQDDKYGKGASSYQQSSAPSYDDSSESYSAAPAPYQPRRPSYPQAMPSYGGNSESYSAPAPAPASYSSGSANEDDDSPFSYMVKKGSSGSSYQAPSHSPPAPTYQSPAPYVPPSSYEPPKPSYQPPSPSYPASLSGDGSYSPSQSYQGSTHGSYSSFNPSGYKAQSYPSQYPDDKSPSTNTYTQADSSYPINSDRSSGRGFYDLAEQVESAHGGPTELYRRRR